MLATAAAPISNRPITLYAAFGVLMGYSFWEAVSAVNQSHYLDLLVVVLLIAGTAWLLHSPSWPPVIFTSVLIFLLLSLAAFSHRTRNEWSDPERVRLSALNAYVVLCVGLMYLGFGFAEAFLARPKRAKRAVRRLVESRGSETE